ncbi:MAG: DUF1697 domain-containing protein [Ferruginibacter sp.]
MKYVVLLRGINVGGKNKVRMVELQQCLHDLGFANATTYIQSGNIILDSKKSAKAIAAQIEKALPMKFKLDSDLIKAFVYSKRQFTDIVKKAPQGFGKEPKKYYYDFIFLSGIASKKAVQEFDQNPEVDAIWTGPGVVYHRRLAAKRTKSRMAKIVAKPIYKNMTIRSWTTTSKLFTLVGIAFA